MRDAKLGRRAEVLTTIDSSSLNNRPGMRIRQAENDKGGLPGNDGFPMERELAKAKILPKKHKCAWKECMRSDSHVLERHTKD